MHWARSVRKSYNYSGLLLSQVGEKVIWLFWSVLVDYVIDLWSRPYRYNIVCCPRRGTMQLHTLLYEGSGHAYALHLYSLRFICIEVLCWHEVDMRRIISIYMRSIVSFIIRGVLSNSCMEVVHLFYIMSLFSLWKLCWINNLIMNLLCIIITCILLWLNWCLIKWMTCLDSLLAEIYSHPIMFFRCLIWMLWLKGGN